jgi:hypothetical protein
MFEPEQLGNSTGLSVGCLAAMRALVSQLLTVAASHL